MADPRIDLPDNDLTEIYRGVITVPYAPLYDNKGLGTGLQTELIYGQGFTVYREGETWVWGQSHPLVKGSQRKAYIGFVSKQSISQPDMSGNEYNAPSHCITALRAPLFTEADIKSPIQALLPLNAQVTEISKKGHFLKLANGTYLHERHVRALDETPELMDYVSIAELYIGAPYVWGGTAIRGVDCSGLVQMSLCAVGRDCPRDADMQEVSLGQNHQGPLDRGDLIFWPGHVGIMSDAETLLHANAFHMSTQKEPYKIAKARIGDPRSIKRL